MKVKVTMWTAKMMAAGSMLVAIGLLAAVIKRGPQVPTPTTATTATPSANMVPDVAAEAERTTVNAGHHVAGTRLIDNVDEDIGALDRAAPGAALDGLSAPTLRDMEEDEEYYSSLAVRDARAKAVEQAAAARAREGKGRRKRHH